MHKPKWGGEGWSLRISAERSSFYSERNSCGNGNKYWLSSFHPNWRFYVNFVKLWEKATRHVESKKISAPLWQCSCSFCPCHPRFSCEKQLAVCSTARCFPDLASCDFWLFSHMKTTLKESDISHGRTSCKNRWSNWGTFRRSNFRILVDLQGEYFEGDWIKLAKFVVLCALWKKVGYVLFEQTSYVCGKNVVTWKTLVD